MFLIFSQYKADFVDEPMFEQIQREGMWHPHLHRKFRENKYEIVDQMKEKYPAFLQLQHKEKESLFLNNNPNEIKQKMECKCRFVKNDSKTHQVVETKQQPEQQQTEDQKVVFKNPRTDLSLKMNEFLKDKIINKPKNMKINSPVNPFQNFRMKEIKDQITLNKDDKINMEEKKFLSIQSKLKNNMLEVSKNEHINNNSSTEADIFQKMSSELLQNKQKSSYDFASPLINQSSPNFFDENKQMSQERSNEEPRSNIVPTNRNNDYMPMIMNYLYQNSLRMQQLENYIYKQQNFNSQISQFPYASYTNKINNKEETFRKSDYDTNQKINSNNFNYIQPINNQPMNYQYFPQAINNPFPNFPDNLNNF
jgi:hypothetical protein